MERTDIMINDWVYMTDKSLYAMQVVSIDGYNCELDFPENEADYFDGIYGENGIAPIPLTEAMLKLNGWDKYPFQGYWENKKVIECCLRKASNGFYCSNGEDDIVRIDYAHELQHLLRLLGYGDLADNFKIK